jgi:hemoglobin/transferrin/lactoferrin receptor protein
MTGHIGAKNHAKGRAKARAALLAALALTTAIGMAMALAVPGTAQAQTAGAAAQAEQRRFDIPAQPLAQALPTFGQQAGIQVSAHGDVVRGAATRGVSGTMTPAAALRQLLAGTGLGFRMTGGGAVILAQPESSSSATMLSPVVVEGAASADPHAGAADRANSITIGQEELERRNPGSMKQVFAGEASVSVGGGQPMSQKVYVQGVEETNLAVSIDGARQNNKVFHHNGTNLIDPELLKLARVDPGVAPADAGPGALGGSIVYETVDAGDLLKPGQSVGGFVGTEYNTNGDTLAFSGSAYARHEGFEVLGFFKDADGSNYKDGDGRAVEGTGAGLQSVLGKLGYESESGHRFEVSAEQVHDEAVRPFRANIGRLTNRNEGLRVYDLKRQNFVFNYSTPHAEGLFDPKLVLGFGRTELGVPTPFGSAGVTSSLSGKVENDFNLSPGNTVTVGVDFYDDEAEYSDPTVTIREAATNVGAYAQARLTPIDRLRLSFGARADRHEFEGVDGSTTDNDGVSGNASAAYDATDWLTLKAGYSRVFGGVALAENFILNENWTYTGGIEAVRSENTNLGFETHYRGFTFGAGIFRSDFDNARNESYGGGAALTADFETKGYNLSVGYNWGPGFARLTYTDTDFEINGQPGDSDFGQYLGTPVGQIFALEVAHSFRDIGLMVGGTLDAALKNDDPQAAGLRPLDSYEAVGLYAQYTPPSMEYLTLRAEANNIFDETYADRATYGQEFGNVIPLYEPGRSFLVKAKVRF